MPPASSFRPRPFTLAAARAFHAPPRSLSLVVLVIVTLLVVVAQMGVPQLNDNDVAARCLPRRAQRDHAFAGHAARVSPRR